MLPIERLLEIMARLRRPEDGCPWDLEQTFESIAPYTIEEAYEVDDAIRRRDWGDLCDELGDLLLQVVYHAQLASEAGHFEFDDVVAQICDKLVRRHPHVFGELDVPDAEAQTRAWEVHKERERAARHAAREDAGSVPSALDGLPLSLPALLRAAKLRRRAQRAGVNPDSADPRREPLEALLGELDSASAGEWLWTCAALVARAGIDPETALREASARFEAGFRRAEAGRSSGGA